jgi:energy-coupling factor transport system permease protein
MAKLLTYEKKDTWIDRLSGVSKLVFFLAWSFTSMLTYDTRVLVVMSVFSIILFQLSKTSWKQVGGILKVIMVFLVINIVAIFLFAPNQGTKIYGTQTVLLQITHHYVITAEQLFYELNIILKYFTIIPSVFMFLVTTNPSEFAASLNRIGVSYNVGYAIAIALRYIPDIQDDFHKIKNTQEARGIEMSGKAPFVERIRNIVAIIFPLIFTSMDRIDTISNAMELRGYGKNKKRTWYMGKKLLRNDYITIISVLAFMVIALVITYSDGSRFYNPFAK